MSVRIFFILALIGNFSLQASQKKVNNIEKISLQKEQSQVSTQVNLEHQNTSIDRRKNGCSLIKFLALSSIVVWLGGPPQPDVWKECNQKGQCIYHVTYPREAGDGMMG